MIGYRGCFRYVGDPDLFVAELLALHKTRRTHDNVHLMIPFVRTAWELRECLALLDRSPLGSDRTLQRWIMAEVPSVVWRLKDYAALGVTAISIGSNDLTQLVLGVDRDNARLARLYDERDPAVLAAIKRIVREAHRHGMTASICGQAPSVHDEYADFLVRCGIDSISVTPDAIERTRLNIARAERRLVLERARPI
jgi:pyruvate,water dikinase